MTPTLTPTLTPTPTPTPTPDATIAALERELATFIPDEGDWPPMTENAKAALLRRREHLNGAVQAIRRRQAALPDAKRRLPPLVEREAKLVRIQTETQAERARVEALDEDGRRALDKQLRDLRPRDGVEAYIDRLSACVCLLDRGAPEVWTLMPTLLAEKLNAAGVPLLADESFAGLRTLRARIAELQTQQAEAQLALDAALSSAAALVASAAAPSA